MAYDPEKTYDYERLRADLLRYYQDVPIGSCGGSLSMINGVQVADEKVLRDFAREAFLPMDRYEVGEEADIVEDIDVVDAG